MSNKEYSSSDLHIAALIYTLGYPLITVKPTTPKRANFIFDDPKQEIEKKVEAYWNREVKINAYDFVQSMRELKARLFSII